MLLSLNILSQLGDKSNRKRERAIRRLERRLSERQETWLDGVVNYCEDVRASEHGKESSPQNPGTWDFKLFQINEDATGVVGEGENMISLLAAK